MRTREQQTIPPFVVDRFLLARERRTRTFAEPKHDPLDDERAQMIVSVLETVRLWGGEERALLKDVASRIESVAETCTAIRNDLGLAKGQHAATKIIPVETLSETVALTRPILAVVEHSEGMVTATYYECEVFGEGETEFEALDDLKESLLEYYLQLRESAEALGPLPAKHLRILSNLVYEGRP